MANIFPSQEEEQTTEYTAPVTVPLFEVVGLLRLYVVEYFEGDGHYIADDWFDNCLAREVPENRRADIKDRFYAELMEPLQEEFEQHLYRLAEYLAETEE